MNVRDVSNVEFRVFSATDPLHSSDALGTEHEQLFGVEKKPAPFLGQFDAVICPIQQAHAKLVLKVANLPCERRLSETELRRRLRKAQFFGDSNEVSQMTKFHFQEHRAGYSQWLWKNPRSWFTFPETKYNRADLPIP
jgi:hypothetical protein